MCAGFVTGTDCLQFRLSDNHMNVEATRTSDNSIHCRILKFFMVKNIWKFTPLILHFFVMKMVNMGWCGGC